MTTPEVESAQTSTPHIFDIFTIDSSDAGLIHEMELARTAINIFFEKWGIEADASLVQDSDGNENNAAIWFGKIYNLQEETVVIYVQPLENEIEDRSLFWGLIHKSLVPEPSDPEVYAEHAVYKHSTNDKNILLRLKQLTQNINQHSEPRQLSVPETRQTSRVMSSAVFAFLFNLALLRQQIFPTDDTVF